MKVITLREAIKTLIFDDVEWIDAKNLWHWVGSPGDKFMDWVRSNFHKSELFFQGKDWEFVSLENYRITWEFAEYLAVIAKTAESKVVHRYIINANKEYRSTLKAIRDIDNLVYEYGPESWQLNRAYALVLGVKTFNVKTHLMEAGWDGKGSVYQELIDEGYALELLDVLKALTQEELIDESHALELLDALDALTEDE